MKKMCLLLASLIVIWMAGLPIQTASAAEPKRADPTLEQRVADLEAYVNNGARVADNTNNVGSKLGSYDGSNFTPNPGPGHNAWQMVSAALVLFMTLPGLALFYGGLVRRKNILSVMAQCLLLAGVVTILWFLCGYSLVFHRGGPFLGGLGYSFFNGVDSSPNTDYSSWVSQNVFCMYQLMFAIITPALIIGSIAERIKFSAFSCLWFCGCSSSIFPRRT